MNRAALFAQIIAKKSYLCVGLDTDPRLLPAHLRSETDPVFAFNQQIIDATADLCVAYKPNVAFYEAQGPRGWESLQRTMEYVPTGHLAIADAKRGDIGNTADLYARAFFDPTAAGLRFDALTVAPYMGRDSVTPFLTYPDKWVVLLALTSNAGSADFQQRPGAQGEPLFETVLRVSQTWTGAEDSADRLMYVVGATHPEAFARVRALAPDHFLLVPGVGAQGGSLAEVSRVGLNRQGGLLVNAARTILYADRGRDFAAAARREAQRMQQEMAGYLDECL